MAIEDNKNRDSGKPQDAASGERDTSDDKDKGVELDEGRRFGINGAWAPQGGQPLDVPERNRDGSPKAPADEPTHLGQTQSTTNSQ